MKVKVEIPATLADITLRQYQRFLKIESPSDMDLMVCMLDSDKNTLSNLKDSEFKRIALHLTSLFDTKTPLTRVTVLNGVKVGLIPDFDAITYGENKDITSYINDWDKMHKAIAVLYRPVTQQIRNKYLIEDYKGTRVTSEMMLDMPLDVVMGVIVFFWTLTNELLNSIPNFIQKEVEKNPTISLKSGQTMKKLTHSLRATLEGMTQLQDLTYTHA